jgi:hypothetical protein
MNEWRTSMHQDEKRGIPQIPIILAHSNSVAAFSIFNPNDWTGLSKSIIQSCAAQLGLIHHLTSEVRKVFDAAEDECKSRFSDLQHQWSIAPWDVEKCGYFVEIPYAHLYIQSFYSVVKTFLDLIVQLISSEGITSKSVHGFHKKTKEIGGECLYILKNRAAPTKREISSCIYSLILEHKNLWIDHLVAIRDLFVHPTKGMFQVMFTLEITVKDGRLELNRVHKPVVDTESFENYCDKILKDVIAFSSKFILSLK